MQSQSWIMMKLLLEPMEGGNFRRFFEKLRIYSVVRSVVTYLCSDYDKRSESRLPRPSATSLFPPGGTMLMWWRWWVGGAAWSK